MLGVRTRTLYMLGVLCVCLGVACSLLWYFYMCAHYMLANQDYYTSSFQTVVDQVCTQKFLLATSLVNALMSIPSVEYAEVVRLPTRQWHISIEQTVPRALINDTYIFDTANNLVFKEYFNDIWYNTVSRVTLLHESLYACIRSLLGPLLVYAYRYVDNPSLVVSSPYQIDLYYSQYCIRYAPDAMVINHDVVKKIISEYKKPLHNNNHVVIDVRFKDQIILYQEPVLKGLV